MSEKGFRIEIPVHIKRDRRARKVITRAETPRDNESIPRIARLLALAHKWEGMVRHGEVEDYAAIAHVAGVTRGRVAQVCSLVLLAPTLQERILSARARWPARSTRRMTGLVAWREQRELCDGRLGPP